VIANGFKAPSGLAVDKQKNIYIANFLSNTIERITADGARSQFSMGVNLKGPIVINRRTLTGKQVIPVNAAEYAIRHPLPLA